MRKKVLSNMKPWQKFFTGFAAIIIAVCVLVCILVIWELLSGRLDHADNHYYCGTAVIDELPARLVSSSEADVFVEYLNDYPIILPPSFYSWHTPINSDPIYRLSLRFERLDEWLTQASSNPEQPLQVILDFTNNCYAIAGDGLANNPHFIKSFYVVMARPVVEEIHSNLKPGESYAFYIAPTLLTFNSFEQNMRDSFYQNAARLGCSITAIVIMCCAILAFLVVAVYWAWVTCVYDCSYSELVLSDRSYWNEEN